MHFLVRIFVQYGVEKQPPLSHLYLPLPVGVDTDICIDSNRNVSIYTASTCLQCALMILREVNIVAPLHAVSLEYL